MKNPHLDPAKISGEHIRAGRMLLGLTAKDACRQAGVSHDSLERLEADTTVRAMTRSAVIETLRMQGVMFLAVGVWHTDGRTAPTSGVVGRFHGSRIRRARFHTALRIERLAGQARVGIPTIERLEAAKDLQLDPCLELYAVIGVLQRAGYYFGRSARGDRPLLPRPVKEPRDWKMGRLKHKPRLQLPPLMGGLRWEWAELSGEELEFRAAEEAKRKLRKKKVRAKGKRGKKGRLPTKGKPAERRNSVVSDNVERAAVCRARARKLMKRHDKATSPEARKEYAFAAAKLLGQAHRFEHGDLQSP